MQSLVTTHRKLFDDVYTEEERRLQSRVQACETTVVPVQGPCPGQEPPESLQSRPPDSPVPPPVADAGRSSAFDPVETTLHQRDAPTQEYAAGDPFQNEESRRKKLETKQQAKRDRKRKRKEKRRKRKKKRAKKKAKRARKRREKCSDMNHVFGTISSSSSSSSSCTSSSSSSSSSA